MANLSFLAGLTTTLTSTRPVVVDETPSISTTATSGNMTMNAAALQALKIYSGSRIAISALNFLNKANLGYETNPETGGVLAIYEGTRSNRDILEVEYKAANGGNDYPLNSAEYKMYNAMMKEWVTAELTTRGLPDNAHFGSVVTANGSRATTSSASPWQAAGGSSEKFKHFNIVPVQGFAFSGTGEYLGAITTRESVPATAEVFVILAAFPDKETLLVQASDIDAVMAAKPIGIMQFASEEVKSRKAGTRKPVGNDTMPDFEAIPELSLDNEDDDSADVMDFGDLPDFN